MTGRKCEHGGDPAVCAELAAEAEAVEGREQASTPGREATREVRSVHRYLPTVYTDQMMVNFVCGCWQGSRAESFNYDCPAHKAGRITTQPELLDALGHPWELEDRFQRRQVTERHSTHKKPHESCDLCESSPAREQT